MGDYKNEFYIKSLLKSHKEIRNSIVSRLHQIAERLEEIDNSMIYSRAMPGLDYSNISVSNSNISDTTSKIAIKLTERKEELYSELAVVRDELDEIDRIFDIYRSLQSHMPIHYEVCNELYLRGCSFESVRISFCKSKGTIKHMADTMISLVCKFFNDGFTAIKITKMNTSDFADYIGKDLYDEINKIEANEKSI